MKRHAISVCIIVFSVFLFQSCETFSEIARTLNNLERLQFRLLAAFHGRRLPARFRLNVAAFNPNDGRGGTTRTISTLTRFDWRLLIDDQPASAAEESGLTEVITDRPSSRRASSPMLASEISGEPEAKVKQHKLSADAGGGYSLSVPKGQHKLSALQPFWWSRPRRS